MLICHAAGLYGMKVDIIRIYQTEAECRRCEAEVQQSIENGLRKSEKLEKRNNLVYNNRICNAETQYTLRLHMYWNFHQTPVVTPAVTGCARTS